MTYESATILSPSDSLPGSATDALTDASHLGENFGASLIDVLSAALVNADWLAPGAVRHMQLAIEELSPPRMARTGHIGGLASWQTRRVEQLVQDNIDSDLSTKRLAEVCALSRGHFCRAFKQTYGMPPHRWVQTQRVERAMERLSKESCAIVEVAIDCGFKDQSHFTRVFKAHARMTPLTWHRRAYYGL